jgi:hypothetical protein
VKAALDALFKAVPWLGWGPIGWLVSYAITNYAGQLYELLKEYIHVESMVIKNEEFRTAYDEASVGLKLIANEKGIESEEFKTARKANREALSQFVRPDAARPVAA